VRFAFAARTNLPDIIQGSATLGGKLDVGFVRIGPGLAEIVAGAEQSAPESVSGSPQPAAACAIIIIQRVNGLAVKVRSGNIPACAIAIGAKKEGAFCGAHEEHDVAIFDGEMANAAMDGGERPT
jgi:hypothetical protein